jgi:hypothetical protein
MVKKSIAILVLLAVLIIAAGCAPKKVALTEQAKIVPKEMVKEIPKEVPEEKVSEPAPQPPQPIEAPAVQPAPTTPPPTEVVEAPRVSLHVRTPGEVFPSSWVNTATPVFAVTRPGVLKSWRNEYTGDEASISDLVLELFMDPELNYELVARWTTDPVADVSNLFVNTYDTHRLTGETELTPLETQWTSARETEVELHGIADIAEDKEYLVTIQSCFPGAPCLEYNVSFTTPEIPAANVDCNRLVDHGQHGRKLDLIFVPFNYTVEELAAGKLEDDVRYLLFHDEPSSADVAARRSLFSIPVFNRSFSNFNVVVVHDEVPCCHDNQLFSVGKRCGFDKGKDIFVVMHNTESGMAYAQGIGIGNWVMMAKSYNWHGVGATLAHEIAHLVGMDEEYYLTSGGTIFPRDAPNCDYGNLTCRKWCSGVRADLVEDIHDAKERYDGCMVVFASGGESEWQSFCRSLDFREVFERAARIGSTFYGVAAQEQLCAKPRNEIEAYVCYAGTLVPLEDENLGVNCRSGYGCYFGCGTQYYYARSDYVSIMGGGALGENNRIYREVDSPSSPILPDFSKATNDALEGYFESFG